ncbi:MAG: methyltransferase domain-containing protein [bacterium]
MKSVCFIQCHYTDLKGRSTDEAFYSVRKIKNSGIFSDIVLAVADLPENRILEGFARKWNLEIFYGSANNLVERMNQVLQKYRADIVVRILIDWFYVDVPLIAGMVQHMEKSNADYLKLPYDFDIKFGADVVSQKAISALLTIFQKEPDTKKLYAFRPWFYLEENSKKLWKTETYNDVPIYSNRYFYQLRKKMVETAPVAWNYGKNFYYHEYAYALNYINSSDSVLDLACGWGNGTAILAKKCKEAIGVDISEEYIEYAKKKYSMANLKYVTSDAVKTGFGSNLFDRVVSVHTIEHIKKDSLFLKELARVLCAHGILFIEAPLRMRRPFIYNNEPLVKATENYAGHYREYTTGGLKKILSKQFRIVKSFGVSRGVYSDLDKARNAVAFVCVKD